MVVLIALSFECSRVQKLKPFKLWSKQSQKILVRRIYLQDIGETHDQVILCLKKGFEKMACFKSPVLELPKAKQSLFPDFQLTLPQYFSRK